MILATLFVVYRGVRYFCRVTEFSKHVDPKAVAGYFHCKVDEAQLSNFDNNYACDFSPQPNPSDVIIVTFINSAWVSLSKNWICSAEKVGLKDKLYLVSFEPNVCSQFPGIPCYEHPGVSISGSSFGMPGYQRLMIERTKLILKLLACGRKVALVDADITFLKDPFLYLNEKMEDKDIVFQSDSSGVKVIDSVLSYFFRYICGGFIYMRSTEAIKHLWLAVLQYQNNFKWNDQAGLNICIRHHTQKVKWNILDSDYFPNGRQYFYYNQTSEKNLIVHANHLMGTDKLIRLMAADLWCDTEYGEKICTEAPGFDKYCSLNQPESEIQDIDRDSILVEEAVKNAINHNIEGVVHDTVVDGMLKSEKVKRMKSDYNLDVVPKWCTKFVKVCRTKFGIKVLE